MLADVSPAMGMKCPEGHGGSPVSLVLYVEDVDSFVKKAVAEGARLPARSKTNFMAIAAVHSRILTGTLGM